MAYCIYTGASVMVQDVKLGDLEASRKIQTFLRALKQGVMSCPLVQRSLDIINTSLHTEKPYYAPAEDNSAAAEALMTRNYLPAFPYRDLQVDYVSGAPPMGAMDLDAFSLLDCFPENHIDNIPGEWYMPPQEAAM